MSFRPLASGLEEPGPGFFLFISFPFSVFGFLASNHGPGMTMTRLHSPRRSRGPSIHSYTILMRHGLPFVLSSINCNLNCARGRYCVLAARYASVTLYLPLRAASHVTCVLVHAAPFAKLTASMPLCASRRTKRRVNMNHSCFVSFSRLSMLLLLADILYARLGLLNFCSDIIGFCLSLLFHTR